MAFFVEILLVNAERIDPGEKNEQILLGKSSALLPVLFLSIRNGIYVPLISVLELGNG